MPNDNSLKIDKNRFKKMIKLKDLLPLFQGKYFEDENGKVIYSDAEKNPPKHRLRKDIQKDIAEMLGVTPVTLSRNANGIQSPSASTLQFFQRNYGINPDWLCGLVGDDLMTTGHIIDRIMHNSQRLDEILKELLEINKISFETVYFKDASTTTVYTDGEVKMYQYGYLVNGIGYRREEFHALAVKLSDFLKFEVSHAIPVTSAQEEPVPTAFDIGDLFKEYS